MRRREHQRDGQRIGNADDEECDEDEICEDSTDDVPDGDAPAEAPVCLTDGSETEEDTPDPENETTDATDSKSDSTESDN